MEEVIFSFRELFHYDFEGYTFDFAFFKSRKTFFRFDDPGAFNFGVRFMKAVEDIFYNTDTFVRRKL